MILMIYSGLIKIFFFLLTESDFLATFGRQKEASNVKHGYNEAWHYEIECEKQRSSSQMKCNVDEREMTFLTNETLVSLYLCARFLLSMRKSFFLHNFNQHLQSHRICPPTRSQIPFSVFKEKKISELKLIIIFIGTAKTQILI